MTDSSSRAAAIEALAAAGASYGKARKAMKAARGTARRRAISARKRHYPSGKILDALGHIWKREMLRQLTPGITVRGQGDLDPKTAGGLAGAGQKFKSAAAALTQARSDLHAAARRGHEAGMSYAEIADAAGNVITPEGFEVAAKRAEAKRAEGRS